MHDDDLAATSILDFESPSLLQLHAQLSESATSDLEFLHKAHRYLTSTVTPVYSLNEWQPASKTLLLRRGSCSQQMACLEALARAHRIPTRVRALWIKGAFWRKRFPILSPVLPRRVLLLWPEFFVEGKWVSFEELFASVQELACSSAKPFLNNAETVFEAIENQAVDFFGKSVAGPCEYKTVDLRSWVIADDSYFATRDEALARYGSLHDTLKGRIFEAVFGNRGRGQSCQLIESAHHE